MTSDDRVLPKNLQRFVLDDLARFTKEGVFSPSASRDFRLFYVGRDDVHGVLRHLLSRVRKTPSGYRVRVARWIRGPAR